MSLGRAPLRLRTTEGGLGDRPPQVIRHQTTRRLRHRISQGATRAKPDLPIAPSAYNAAKSRETI